MRHLPVAILLLGSTTLGTGCRNACQAMCREMYDYANECGYGVSKDELKACYQEQSSSNTPRTERQLCRDYFDDMRDEWTCEDLADYWDDDPGLQQSEDTAVDTAYLR